MTVMAPPVAPAGPAPRLPATFEPGCCGSGSSAVYVDPSPEETYLIAPTMNGPAAGSGNFYYNSYAAGAQNQPGSQQFRCLRCCLALLTVAALGAAAAILFMPDGVRAPTAETTFDCNAGFDNDKWKAGWSASKKAWCCSKTDRGCSSSEAFDCQAGVSRWQTGWSAPKKSWCCSNKGVGCPALSGQFDCNTAYNNWRNAWSDAKKDWCCTQVGKGCPSGPDSFDCSAGFANWVAAWSATKKGWCCANKGRGCTAP